MKRLTCFALSPLMLALITTLVVAEEVEKKNKNKEEPIDTIVVLGKKQTFASNVVSMDMISRRPVNASVNTVVQELPGVIVQEADTFGSADWMTNIRMRGFNTSNGQIGTTLDGLPNGGSGYGGGSKANKFIDVLDLETVEVSQGTADISSRSNEALGGTLNFITSDPMSEENLSILYMAGDQDASKYRFRYDSGEITDDTYFYISGSSSENKDVWDNEAVTEKDYLTGKLKTEINGYNLSAFATYNDSNENEYEYVSLEDYYENPNHDGLHMNWTGIPGLDENYRAGWRALRDNSFYSFTIDKDFGDFAFNSSVYYHRMKGRGDWIPPYVTDVDGDGDLSNELSGETIYGDYYGDDIYFVNAGTTTAGTLIDSCVGRYDLDAEKDPNCYEGNVEGVSSYRTSNYANHRYGVTADASYDFVTGQITHSVRGGLWYENYDADVIRQWHLITDPEISLAFNKTPYWVQYKTEANTKELMYYVQENMDLGPLSGSIGLKQFQVDTQVDHFYNDDRTSELDSTSDPLLYAGVTYTTPIQGLEFFAGYSENYKAVESGIIDSGLSNNELGGIDPETSDNVEVGFRYNNNGFKGAVTLYDIKFDNRIVEIDTSVLEGNDYKGEVDGTYVNVGGQKSSGAEILASYQLTSTIHLSGSYTYNDSVYLSTGDTGLDEDSEIRAGNEVYGEPKTFFTIAADYMGEITSSGVSLRHIGDRYINFENSAIAPGYEVVDAYIGVDFTNVSSSVQAVRIRLNVNNLLDDNYISGVGSDSVYPGSPRTVTLSVGADF
jgi:outer membrane receptor protein involved in Fe transport